MEGIMAENTDGTLLGNIDALVREEQELYRHAQLSDHDQVRLEKIKVELDRCWDLLRQRDALRAFDKDPSRARVRPASVVEKSIG
jgi:Protein of unknown function (DUF2630)